MTKWVESATWPGWGHLEPFHDNENELIPSYIGKAIEAHIQRVESANAELLFWMRHIQGHSHAEYIHTVSRSAIEKALRKAKGEME